MAKFCPKWLHRAQVFLKKSDNPGLFFVYFLSFQTDITVFTTNKSLVHLVYGAMIRTHNLWNICCLPSPLDQGSRPGTGFLCEVKQSLLFSAIQFDVGGLSKNILKKSKNESGASFGMGKMNGRDRERELGSSCGSVGKAVSTDTRGPRFESSHRQNLYWTFV